MTHYCSAPRCSNTRVRGYSLIRVPHDDENRRKWKKVAGDEWTPSLNAFFCEVHFHPDEVIISGQRKIIKKGSVPSRFCECETPPNIPSEESGVLQEHNYSQVSQPKLLKTKYIQFRHGPFCCCHSQPLKSAAVNLPRSIEQMVVSEPTTDFDKSYKQNKLDFLKTEIAYSEKKKREWELNKKLMEENTQLKSKLSQLQNDILHIASFAIPAD